MMRIAVFGCGQLSRMMALAGLPMGLNFHFLAEPGEDTRCVEGLGTVTRWAPGQTAKALYAALGRPDVITIEREEVDITLLRALMEFCPVSPSPDAIAQCQDRGRERALLDRLAIPCAPYVKGTAATLAVTDFALPAVIKSCREGYDGRNQWPLKEPVDLEVLPGLDPAREYLMEAWIPFDREISQISVRAPDGQIHHYPLTENAHHEGILKHSVAPAQGVSPRHQELAQDYITRLMTEMDYVGVLAMECFVVGDALLVNELAPRVHNSGHWTQAGSATCQFENHLRAIAALPLGDTLSKGVAGMVNLIGTPAPPLASLAATTWLNWYGKVTRPGRKLGHINFLDSNHDRLLQRMARTQQTQDMAR